ncbi:uncharacterized protein LOC143305586 [Osmia lignaria lignaria]|uniref:uncharacterized protein LOC143305586 n=1 Tax=Osmia lignaria lignaria TaxID=1437193 RepID=UPI00402B6C77
MIYIVVNLISRRRLVDLMFDREDLQFSDKLEYIESYITTYDNYSSENVQDIRKRFSYIKSELKRRWSEAQNTKDRFYKKNNNWLNGTFELPVVTVRSGRPSKSFEESSDRTKRRKTAVLRSTTNTDELVFSAQMKLQSSGKRSASTILKEITNSPERAKKYKTAYSIFQHRSNETLQLSSLKALSMFVEAGLSKHQYLIIRKSNHLFYPSYNKLLKEKLNCYPQKESYQVTSTCAEVNLQDLLNHTATRLLTYLEHVLINLDEDECKSLSLISKWGCDGSQQSHFKQAFDNEFESDENIFQSSFVPLQLNCALSGKKLVWQNPTPSSPRYCRPIRIRFVKETFDVITSEIDYIRNAINSLQPTKLTLFGRDFSIQHKMILTMVDGKICNAITQTLSTRRCYICGATSTEFNDLTKLQVKDINPDSLEFGLSILHARIRLFESLLHLSYKVTVKKWIIRKTDVQQKKIIEDRKLNIQKEFKSKLGLLVDIPKPGFGNTNNGNTSRKFFANPDLCAEITGLDRDLIYRFAVILELISSGHKINTKKFDTYTLDTAKLYINLYSWYPMTPTMHKILLHGSIIIEHALLPIGQLSEEAAEARNKHFRLYRQNYSRKFSRESCNLDVINRLLLTSDPLLTGIRKMPRKRTKQFLKETIEMFLPAETPRTAEDSSSDEQLSDGDL